LATPDSKMMTGDVYKTKQKGGVWEIKICAPSKKETSVVVVVDNQEAADSWNTF